MNIQRIKSKDCTIGVIGMGYVGLPLMLRFVEQGFKVVGIDNDPTKVEKIRISETYIKHIEASVIERAMATKLLSATTDFAEAEKCDALIICVPTPLTQYREPDLSYVISTTDSLVPFLRKGQIVSLESTTYPGTTEEVLRPRIEKMGLKVGEDVFLVFSPEREDPGNKKFSTQTMPKVVGGTTPACLEAGIALYSSIVDRVVPVRSTQTAEMTKLLENIFRAVNIGLVNELKTVTDKMGIDIWEVVDAASTKPFGFVPFYPGPGLGGHCIPIDPFYLTWKAREYGLHTRFIELAGEVNHQMPEWVVGKIFEALNSRSKSVKGSNILVLGVAYKKNIDDMRESPALRIMDLLEKRGAVISYSDPFVSELMPSSHSSFSLKNTELTAKILKEADCVVITTDHDDFNYELIQESSSLIVDTRGRYRRDLSNVVRS